MWHWMIVPLASNRGEAIIGGAATHAHRTLGVGGPLVVCRRYAGLAHFGQRPTKRTGDARETLRCHLLSFRRPCSSVRGLVVSRAPCAIVALAMGAGEPAEPWRAHAPMDQSSSVLDLQPLDPQRWARCTRKPVRT